MGVFRYLNRFLSPAGERAKLLTFIFHRVLSQSDPLRPFEPTINQFDWMMRLIAENFTVLRLEEAVQRLAEGTLPSAAACITFDDGYRDNAELARPILSHYGLVGTFFIATSFLETGRMWNDDIIEAVRNAGAATIDWSGDGLGKHNLTTADERLKCIASVLGELKYFPHNQREKVARKIAREYGVKDSSNLMMTEEQVRELVAHGMEIGAHTHTHPILSHLQIDEARSEILVGRLELERITRIPVRVFAYPNGDTGRDLTQRDASLIKRMGFVCGMTTDRGVSDFTTDHFMMPRFTPWDRNPGKFALRSTLALKNH